MNKALLEIEKLTAALRCIGKELLDLQSSLDTITKSHTAFASFTALVHAPSGYFPSLPTAPAEYDKTEIVIAPDGRRLTWEIAYAEMDFLALAYDMAQQARNDSRRAFRS